MSITVLKKGNTLQVLQASDAVPDGTKLTLYTAEELTSANEERRQWLEAQMPAFVRGDENEAAEELF
jgi:hypothetical protein